MQFLVREKPDFTVSPSKTPKVNLGAQEQVLRDQKKQESLQKQKAEEATIAPSAPDIVP